MGPRRAQWALGGYSRPQEGTVGLKEGTVDFRRVQWAPGEHSGSIGEEAQ